MSRTALVWIGLAAFIVFVIALNVAWTMWMRS